ncbi:hypothetical protein MAR_014344 [Mya arenaria]|uniref:Reverse transcriptase zinc-binding domain-containing protein n=1 Tax=Mya arenaria TaxID=6604 RepID=A0ABY7G2J0_MYAAR|nr:hypothetical protein MAR_014344 [Mya arenaria]
MSKYFYTQILSLLSCNTSIKYGFIPYICNTLCKYDLYSVINNVLVDPTTLPSKYVWKRTVKQLVYETEMWRYRMMTDSDFVRFRILQPTISPSIVYMTCCRAAHRNFMHEVAKLWCRSCRLDSLTLCQNCNVQTTDKIVHLVCECAATTELRTKYVCAIACFGIEFISEILQLDESMFTMKLMDAPLAPLLNNNENKDFLLISFQFIGDCLLCV